METRIAKITKTFLGYEDHGCMTAMLTLDYGGSAQGAGGYSLDKYDKGRKRRVGTAFGIEWIASTLKACGVDSWEKVQGCTVLADIADGRVVGLRPLPTERGEPFDFAELSLSHASELN